MPKVVNFDNMQIQVFHQLQRKLPDVLKAVEAIISAHKKGQGKSGEVGDGMTKLMPSDLN